MQIRINERIRIPQVRLIGPQGEQLGVISSEDALKKAQEYGLDLVEVAPSAKPPVCRIIDFSKYKYEQEKRKKESRKRQKVLQQKEIKVKPNIEEHDYQPKLRHAQRFLTEGDKVKFTMMFKGREAAHMDRGRVILDRFAKDLAPLGELEASPFYEGKNIFITLIIKIF